MELTTKEQSLLEDQLVISKLQVAKFHSYASMASDPKIKQFFSGVATKEQQHVDSIVNTMTSGGIKPSQS
jgi:hypothetical protein